MNTLILGRDPFARHTIRARRVYELGNRDCAWCGQCRHTPKYNRPFLFQYYVDADSPRESGDIKGLFCSIGCARNYHS